jgi:hypothetical protein
MAQRLVEEELDGVCGYFRGENVGLRQREALL